MDLAQLILGFFLATGTGNQAAAPQPTARPVAAPASRPSPTGDQTRLGVDPSQVVDKVQAFYKVTGQLGAKFRQTVVNETFGRTTVSDGRVYIKKPGKMRWDYYSKSKKTQVDRAFLSDGKMLWAVFMSGKTYYKKDVKDDLLPVAITFLSGKGDLKTDFDAVLDTSGKRGGKGDHVLELTPKKPSAQYKTLWLVVDGGDYRVKQSIIKNANNELTTFAFFEPDTKTTVADTTFVFNEKESKTKGFRVVEPPRQ